MPNAGRGGHLSADILLLERKTSGDDYSMFLWRERRVGFMAHLLRTGDDEDDRHTDGYILHGEHVL